MTFALAPGAMDGPDQLAKASDTKRRLPVPDPIPPAPLPGPPPAESLPDAN